MYRLRTILGTGLVLLTLAGCGDRVPTLMNIRADGAGPDEFGILPTRPLEMPEDFASLPTPTPGGGNRVDLDPEADAIAALGGNIDRAGGVSSGLAGYVTRFGITPGIRAALAAEDEEYRRRNDGRLLERIFAVNVYYDAYEPVSLDQYRELERMRRAGIRTPAAPPEPQN